MTKICYVLAMAACCSSGSAVAQDATPRGTTHAPLVVFHSAGDAREAAEDALRRSLAGLARTRGGAFLDLSPAPAPAPRAAERWQQGLEAYSAFEYDEAIEHLDAAQTEVAHTGGAGLSARELSDLHILRSLVFSQRGDNKLAWDELVAAATLDTTRQLDPVRFPPRVLESFGRAIEAVRAAPFGQFAVDVEAGCQVWLDGHSIAAGEYRSLAFGHHYVRVRCPGVSPYGARVLVQKPRERWRPALHRPQVPADARLLELARERGAGSLIVARVVVSADAPASVAIRWIDLESARDRQRLTGALASEGDARAIARATEDMLGRRGLERMASERKDEPKPRPRAWHQRPWVWAAIGAATTALILSPLLLDSPSPRGFEVRPRGDLPGAP